MYGLSIGTTSGQVGDHVLPLMRFWVIMEKTVPNSCDVVTVTNVDTDNVQGLGLVRQCSSVKAIYINFFQYFYYKKLSQC